MITERRHADVAVICLSNPPVNALGVAMRRALEAAVLRAQSDVSVKAVIIRAEGRFFSAGADIAEFSAPIEKLELPDLLDLIEKSSKPVLAAINGVALGGGLELALACHYRIASSLAKMGLPEVKLGILPGAGGTQRLPRVIGVGPALSMIVGGEPIDAEEALSLGLVDRLSSPEEFDTAILNYAREIIRLGVRRTGDLEALAETALFDGFRAENQNKIRGMEAPTACIRAVEIATQVPLDEGLKMERRLFDELVQGFQSQALRHIFFAERQAAKLKDIVDDVKSRPIERVGIVGAGTMGGGIAMNFLSAGISVVLVEMTSEALDRGIDTIRRNYQASVNKGRISSEQHDRAISLLQPSLNLADIAHCDLVIEAVYENMAVKKELFSKLDEIAKPGAILASNTSYLDIDDIAAVTGRPRDVLGLHFFSPANIMRLLEIVCGRETAPDVLQTALRLAKRIGKTAVVAGVCYGFIGNRIIAVRQDNALALLVEGATAEQIDRVHTRFGMPLGPFQMSDLAGVDIGWHRESARIETLPDALCAAGRWGQKTRAGYYDYDDRRKPHSSAAFQEIVTAFRETRGIVTREISDEEIEVRTLYTMINEAADILDEGIAQRASDIDVVYVHGYGWPRHTGGPMFWADHIGLSAIIAKLDEYADKIVGDFAISPYLRHLAQSSGNLIVSAEREKASAG